MICKHILKIMFLVESKFICLHTVEWSNISILNNSI